MKFLKKSSYGFTLVELLIALIVTALISISITRVLIDTSANLERLATEASANQQGLQFIRKIQSDFKNSLDIYVFDSNYPSTQSDGSVLTCTNATPADWSSGSQSFTRQLFTVVSKKLTDLPPDYTPPTQILTPEVVYIGYEIRLVSTSNSGLTNALELWRNECSSLGGAVTYSLPVLTLGDTLCSSTIEGVTKTGIAMKKDRAKSNCQNEVSINSAVGDTALSGTSIVSCTSQGSTSSNCPLNTSTLISYNYDIQLPISRCSPPIMSSLAFAPRCPNAGNASRLTNPLFNLGRIPLS